MGEDLMAQQWDVPGYAEVKVLGSGGLGDVVLARHDASGTRAAIKYLRRELLADPEFTALFQAEAGASRTPTAVQIGRIFPDRPGARQNM